MKKIIIPIIVILIIAAGSYLIFTLTKPQAITNFEKCVKQGGQIHTTVPYTCKTLDGMIFTRTTCIGHGETPSYTGNPEDDMGKQCCSGLEHRSHKDNFEENENCRERLILGYKGICLDCGDGKCDKKFETQCNCPEDCK